MVHENSNWKCLLAKINDVFLSVNFVCLKWLSTSVRKRPEASLKVVFICWSITPHISFVSYKGKQPNQTDRFCWNCEKILLQNHTKSVFFSTEYCSKTMTSGGSSFQRKIKSKWADIPGVNPSIYTNQLLTSSGVPDLGLSELWWSTHFYIIIPDDLIGGGLAVGSVILLEEDLSGNYSRLMLKYFLSEGLLHKHPLLVTNSSPGLNIYIWFFNIKMFL